MQEYLQAVALERNILLPENRRVYSETVLAGGPWGRLKQYRELAEKQGLLGGIASCVFVDLEQNPGFRRHCQADVLPTILTHGQFFELIRRRTMLPEEFFLAQAFSVPGLAGKEEHCPFAFIFSASKRVSDVSLKQLAGNSMHCCALASVLLWLLAHMQHV